MRHKVGRFATILAVCASTGCLVATDAEAQRRCRVEDVIIAPSDPQIGPGEVLPLTAVAFDVVGNPCDNPPPFVWSSGNVHIATIDANGIARGVRIGTTIIAVRSGTKTARAAIVVQPGTMGTISLSGVPSGARVTIDGIPRNGASFRVGRGGHLVEVEMEGFHPYRISVQVQSEATVDLNAALTPLPAQAVPPGTAPDGSGCANPMVNIIYGNRCWDTRPQPRSQPVLLPPETCSRAVTPAEVLVHVSATGEVASASIRRSSNCPDFNIAVVAQVEEMMFFPAMKSGSPVAAWIIVVFRPARS